MISHESDSSMCSGLRRLLEPVEAHEDEVRHGALDPVPIDILVGSTYERVLLIEKIGEGGFGKVYRGELETDRSISYAVKCVCIRKQRSVIANEVSMHREISERLAEITAIDTKLVSPVVEFKGCTEERIDDNHHHFFIATEFCPDGDLCSLIMKDYYQADDAYVKKLFLQICDAVEICHAMHVYHRDLKPDNIFCKKGANQVVLGDFGFATKQRRQRHFEIGSAPYMSPELRGCQEFCAAKADVWALGVILVALITRNLPWEEAVMTDYDYAFYKHCDPNHLLRRYDISKEVNGILKRVFCDPHRRLSVSDLRMEIERIDTFGPGTQLIYDLDLGSLQTKIARKYGPRKSLLLPLKFDQLHHDAHSVLWSLPSQLKVTVTSVDIQTWGTRAEVLRRREELLVLELGIMDPFRHNQKCQYKARRVKDVLGHIDQRLAEIRSFKDKKPKFHGSPAGSSSDITSAALKIVSDFFGITSEFVNGSGAQSAASSLLDTLPPPIAEAPCLSSDLSSYSIPIYLVPPPTSTTSDASSGEDSAGPVTPETIPADAVTPALEEPPLNFTLPAIQEEGNIEELDLANSGGSAIVALRKPPAVAIPSPAPLPGQAVAAAKLPPIRVPSLSQWPLPPEKGTWLISRKPNMKRAPAPPKKKKATPPPMHKRSPSSSQRLFQAAARFLASPVRVGS